MRPLLAFSMNPARAQAAVAPYRFHLTRVNYSLMAEVKLTRYEPRHGSELSRGHGLRVSEIITHAQENPLRQRGYDILTN